MTINGTDFLSGCSKLQDLLELLIQTTNQHGSDIATLKEDHSQALIGLDAPMLNIDEVGSSGNTKAKSVTDRLAELEALVAEQSVRHADLVGKVGVDHLELEADNIKFIKMEEELQRLAELETKLEEEIHHVEEEMHNIEDHEKQLDETVSVMQGEQVDQRKNLVEQVNDLEAEVLEMKIKIAELSARAAGGGDDNSLSPEIMQAIADTMAPLGAAIDALDAKYECHVVIRLESHEQRLTEQEELHKSTVDKFNEASDREAMAKAAAAAGGGSTSTAWGGGQEQREAALREIADAQNSVTDTVNAVRNEMLDAQNSMADVRTDLGQLSSKVSEVVFNVTSLESELRDGLRQSDALTGPNGEVLAEPSGEALTGPGGELLRLPEAGGGPRQQTQQELQVEATLRVVREQLEGRVLALEQKLDLKEPHESAAGVQDLAELSSTLQQVETDLRSLDAVATKDMRPKLEKQATEMQRLWRQLDEVLRKVANQPAGAGGAMAVSGSMLTTTQGPRCLVCYDGRTDGGLAEAGNRANRVMIGKDGHTYFQGARPGSAVYAAPVQNERMIRSLHKSQSGGGRSSRKYMDLGTTSIDDIHNSSVRSSSRPSARLRLPSPAGNRPGTGRLGGSKLMQKMTPSVAGFYF